MDILYSRFMALKGVWTEKSNRLCGFHTQKAFPVIVNSVVNLLQKSNTLSVCRDAAEGG